MATKREVKLLTHVARGVAFGDTSNSAVRNILTEISKELYGQISEDQMRATMDFFNWKCPYTGRDLSNSIASGDGSYAADHIYPQNQDWCGLNVQGNLVIVDKAANAAKRGLDVETFLFTDTEVLNDIDNGKTRQERLDKIKEFQAKFQYDPDLIRKIVRPLMEERYRIVREEQEACIRDVMVKLEAAGIKPQDHQIRAKTKHTTLGCTESDGRGYTYEEKIKVAAYYLRHNEGLKQVEENHMGLVGRNGATAKYILNKLGIDTSKNANYKGLLLVADIDDEIRKATDAFKLTLEEIKKRGF